MSKLRIMSNNIWWCDANNEAWASKGFDCSAAKRSVGFFRLYKETMPDIIGFQECSNLMGRLLRREFENEGLPYEYLYGRDTPIMLRKDKFDIIETASLVYNEEVPGVEGSFNNAQTKSYCVAAVREKTSNKKLIFATTHLWWMSSDKNHKNYYPHSDEARTYQLNLLLQRIEEFIKKYDCPAVVVGDLNSVYSSRTVQSALTRGYVHAHDIAIEYKDETQGMHFCYAEGFDTVPSTEGFDASIDHILLKGIPEDAVKCFERYSPDYYMPLSDHFPVWIDMEF